MALVFTIRAKKTYFLDSVFFIAAANVGFILFLSDTTASDLLNKPPSPYLDTIFLTLTAISIGFASYLLKESEGKGGFTEFTRFLNRPPKALLVFLFISIGWATTALIWQPFTVNSLMTNGEYIYYFSYQTWYLASSSLLLASFIALPVFSFYEQSRRVQDPKASGSIRLISLCWACFGLITFLQEAFAGSYASLVKSFGSLADGTLFVLVSFALREPTILSRIVTGGEMIFQAVSSRTEEDTIVLYNTESDRKRLVERFVDDGIATGQELVFYVIKSEVPFYRAILKGTGTDHARLRDSQTTIQSIDFGAGETLSDLAVPPGFHRSKRELVDLGELSLDQCNLIISKVKSLDNLPGPRRRPRIWALNVEEAQSGTLEALREANPKARVRDLALQQDSFSKLLNTKHQALSRNRILLEYDPASNYEDAVQKFVREFQANVEPIAIFTSMGSPTFRQFRGQHNLRMFTFSTKTSTPSKVSEELVLLPERDTSLLLDAVDKLLQANHGRLVGMVFDVFTDLILFQGFEKGYGVLSSVVEMSESESASTLVLINFTALDERALNGVRGLFRSQAKYDMDGFKMVRTQNTGYSGFESKRPTLEDESQGSDGRVSS
ncbi:hypothetical protein E6H19_10305 [Candidatus Bathyarchaeota archaeon]|nr:MAG: hypothetical protein E6H19_10305 [Candidatus Bathyarchaeota archaeon]